MKFVYNFYVLIVVSRSSFGAGTRVVFQAVWVVWSKADFDVEELKHLSKKLSSVECAKLLEEIYLMTDFYVEKGEHDVTRRTSRRDVQVTLASESNCLAKLEEWNRKCPGTGNSNARTSMEIALKALGRPDLVKYIRKTRKVVQFLNRIVQSGTESTFTEEVHSIFKRHVTRSPNNVDLQKKVQWRSRKDLETRFKEDLEENGQVKSAMMRKADAREDMGRIEEETVQDDERIVGKKSRWVAFAILLGVVVVFFCAIVLCACYKKKSGQSPDTRLREERKNEMESEKRICTVCCTPIRQSRRRSSSSGIDIEGEKWKNTKKKKYSRIASDKCYENKLEQEKLLDVGQFQGRYQRFGDEGKGRKNLKRKEEKVGKMKKRGSDLAGSYCVKSKSVPRKSQKFGKSLPRTSHSDLKKFQEKILSLLRKECDDCKCCQCIFANEGKGKSGKVKFLEKNGTCYDPNCKTHRAKSIVDFCLSDETAYLKNIKNSKNSENLKNLKKKKKREEKKEVKRSSRCSSLSRRRKEKRKKGEQMIPCDGKMCSRCKFSKSPKLEKERIQVCVNAGTKQKQKKFF